MAESMVSGTWEWMMFVITLVRAGTLLFAAIALFVSVVVGGWDRLFDPGWLGVAILSALGYVASSALFFVLARTK